MMMKMMYDNANGIITDRLAELNETVKDFEDIVVTLISY